MYDPEYLQPHISYILSHNTDSLSTHLKVLPNWSNVTTFVIPYITSSIECISKFLRARRMSLKKGYYLIQVQASMIDVLS